MCPFPRGPLSCIKLCTFLGYYLFCQLTVATLGFYCYMMLQINTFNCRGLHDNFKRKKVFNFLREFGYDIIFLQETHSRIDDEKLWRTQWGGEAVFGSYCSNSRGVAILFKASLKISVLSFHRDPEGRYIILHVNVNDVHFILVNLYGPNKDSPDFFVNVFAKLDEIGNSHVILAGDLNIAVGPLDYEGSNARAKIAFNMYVEELSLVDVWRTDHTHDKICTRHQKIPFVSSR